MATGIQISPSSDITVGTTAISNGTEGRVLFQGAGNVVQQDAGLFWDNTNKRLGIGATPSTSVRLDVRAQGALSTDITFRVRNSADSANLLAVQGNNVVQLGASNINFPTLNLVSNVNPAITFSDINGSTSFFKQYYQANGAVGSLLNESLTISKLGTPLGGNGEAGRTNFINSTTNWGVYLGSANRGGYHFYFNNSEAITETDRAFWITPDRRQLIYNKSGDTVVGDVNSFCFYSDDQTAGNAAPHFRTENGSVVKLYQQTSTGTETVADVVQYLKNLGLLV
jgi:hypothetical protein